MNVRILAFSSRLGLLAGLLLLGLGLFSTPAEAYRGHVGYHGYHHGYYGHRGYYGNYRYYNPVYRNRGLLIYQPGYTNSYWTNWRTFYYQGRSCQKTCLVNRLNGYIIKCQTRCYR